MHDYLFALKLFVRVAHTGSFSAAGRELGLTQPSVSRMVSSLEQEVGAQLLTRTTRAVAWTEAGADFLARVEGMLLPDWDMGAIEVNAVFPAGRASKPSAKAFVDYIRPRLQEYGIS